MAKERMRVRIDSVVEDGPDSWSAFAHAVGKDGVEPVFVRSPVPFLAVPGREVVVEGWLRPSPPEPRLLVLPEGTRAVEAAAAILKGRFVVRGFAADGRPLAASECAGMTLAAAADLGQDATSGQRPRVGRPEPGGGLEVAPEGRPRDSALALASEILAASEHGTVLLLDPMAARTGSLAAPTRLTTRAVVGALADGAPAAKVPLRLPGGATVRPAAIPQDFKAAASGLPPAAPGWSRALLPSERADRVERDPFPHSAPAVIQPFDPYRTSAAYAAGLSLLDPSWLVPRTTLPPAFRRAQEAAHEAAHATGLAASLASGSERECFCDCVAVLALARAGFPREQIATFVDLRQAAALSTHSLHQTGPAAAAALALADRLGLPTTPPPPLDALLAQAATCARENAVAPAVEAKRVALLQRAGSSEWVGIGALASVLDLLQADPGQADREWGRLVHGALGACARAFRDIAAVQEDPAEIAAAARGYEEDLRETAAALPGPTARAVGLLLAREGECFPARQARSGLGAAVPVARFGGGDLGSQRQRALDRMALSAWPAAAARTLAAWLDPATPTAAELLPSTRLHPALATLLAQAPAERVAELGRLAAAEASALLAALDQRQRIEGRDGASEQAAVAVALRRREAALSLVLDPAALDAVAPSGTPLRRAIEAAAAPPRPLPGGPSEADLAAASLAARRLGVAVDPRTILREPVAATARPRPPLATNTERD